MATKTKLVNAMLLWLQQSIGNTLSHIKQGAVVPARMPACTAVASQYAFMPDLQLKTILCTHAGQESLV